MKRRNFVASILALIPTVLFARFELLKSYGNQVGLRVKEDQKGFMVKAGEARFGRHFKMKGVTRNILDIKISAKDTENDLAVFEQTGLSPYGGPPLHIHPFQDEWFYVVEGEYLFQVGDEQYEMKQGDTIFLPRKVKHAFIQLTDQGKMIVSYLPAGKMEAFFEVTDKWTAPPSKEKIVKVFADHDMVVVGEPLKLIRNNGMGLYGGSMHSFIN
jgi:quercetin dioxygenase-like cupin family protein